MRWAGWGIAVGSVTALITQAPAHWLAHAVAHASHQRVLLTQPQGTVWHGSATWALSDGQVGAPSAMALPSRLQWHLAPHIDWTRVSLGLRAQLDAACCTPQPLLVDITPRWQGVRIHMPAHTSHWPAHWLVGLGAPWNTVQPEGQLQLSTQGFTLHSQAGQWRLDGQVQMQLAQLSTRLSTMQALGSYRVLMQGGDTIAVKLDTVEGKLQLQGEGQWLDGRLRFKGEASAQPEFEAALSNLLNILGQRRGNKSIMELG
jgi:general secretion pathway protein N